jgi:Transposase Tn5 dimerisation domain/Transposase DNA-binding
MQAWIHDEFDDVDLGDHRLDERLRRVVDALSEQPERTIPAACHGRAEMEAAYRLLDNEKVSEAKILAPHRAATLRRLAGVPLALLGQDTTEFDFTRTSERLGGPLSDEARWGLLGHVMMAFTPEGLPLGVLSATLWARDPARFGHSRKDRMASLDFKETSRWLTGYRAASTLAKELPETALVVLSDSEGDLYECLAEVARAPRGQRAHFVTRACHDRRLAGEEAGLWQTMAAKPVSSHAVVDVKPRQAASYDGRKRRVARTRRLAKVSIRSASVTILRPQQKGPEAGPAKARINAVLVREEAPPQGVVPVEWLLLTDLPIDTVERIDKIIAFYGVRWGLEVFFRVLKSGCRVEQLQLETAPRLRRCLTLYLVIAWRVLQLTMLGRTSPDLPCSVLFETDEWQALYAVQTKKPIPKRPPPLGEAVRLLAGLGGYMDRSCDGDPGPQALWIGLAALANITVGWQAAHSRRAAKADTCVER